MIKIYNRREREGTNMHNRNAFGRRQENGGFVIQ
jgi:hypothetical protein